MSRACCAQRPGRPPWRQPRKAYWRPATAWGFRGWPPQAGGGSRARRVAGVAVLAGGRLTLEDAYAYAKFARVALDTNDIDMRARPHSAEEEQFLASRVAGRGTAVSYADLEAAPAVLLAGFEPEDESPIVFLRLRKAARTGNLAVYSVAALGSPGLVKVNGTLLPTVPGQEPAALTALAAGGSPSSVDNGSVNCRMERRRCSGVRARSGDPRRGTARGGTRGAGSRRAPGRRDRRQARLDPPPGGRARCHRGGRAAQPAAGRPSGHQPAGPRRGGAGVEQGLAAHDARAGTRRASWPPPSAASSGRWSSPASTRRTCPTRRRRCAPWKRRRSSSAWNCGPAR